MPGVVATGNCGNSQGCTKRTCDEQIAVTPHVTENSLRPSGQRIW